MSFVDRVKALRSDLKSRAEERRQRVATDLAILISKAGFKRKEIAQKLEITEAALSIRLNGTTNLTLDSIGGICDAAGFDFDVHFRRPGEAPAASFWELEEALMPPAHCVLPDTKTEKKEVDVEPWLGGLLSKKVVYLYDVKNYQLALQARAANDSIPVNDESQRATA
jgi:transcriptional regulator with XRE-family HTH domain